jgi:hypothetical protein
VVSPVIVWAAAAERARARNVLNNRRANLGICDAARNQQKTGARGGASRFKCISWVKSKNRWKVAFNWRGKTHFIGYFTDEVEAARGYNKAILPLAGEFGHLNGV